MVPPPLLGPIGEAIVDATDSIISPIELNDSGTNIHAREVKIIPIRKSLRILLPLIVFPSDLVA